MNLDFPKGPYTLFTNIVDEKTFMIGDKTYIADQELELTPEEQAALAEIREADHELRRLRQELVDVIHVTDKTFIPEIQSKVHTMGLMGTALKVKIPLFVMGIAVRMGGRLPLTINQELTKVTVRARNTGESLNYTVATALDATMLTTLAEQRSMAFAIVGDKAKATTKINGAVEFEHNFQPVELDVTDADELGDANFRNVAMPQFLKKHPYPMTMTVIVGNTKGHYSVINFASQAGNKQKQVDIQSLRDYCNENDVKDVFVVWPKMTPKKQGWTVMVARRTAHFDEKGKLEAEDRTYAFDMNEKGELASQSDLKGFVVEGIDQSIFLSLVKNPNQG